MDGKEYRVRFFSNCLNLIGTTSGYVVEYRKRGFLVWGGWKEITEFSSLADAQRFKNDLINGVVCV